MSQAAEYRTFADECLGWAKTARSERERNIFLQMAQTWLNAAVLAEGRAAQESSPGAAEQQLDSTGRTANRA
jgi:hypothetical protein